MPNKGIQYYSNIGLDDYYDQWKIDYNSRLAILEEAISNYRHNVRELNKLIRQDSNYNAKLNAAKRKINKKIEELVEVKDELLKRRRVSGSLYKSIIKLYYANIKDQLLKGYKFRFGFKLGTIVIVQEYNRKYSNSYGEREYRINWKGTLEKRDELLKSGIPKEDLFNYDKFQVMIEEYRKLGFSELDSRIMAKLDKRTGIKYFQYYDTEGFVYWLRWYKQRDTMPNINLYSLIFARDIARSAMRLQKRTDIDGVFKLIDKRFKV